MHFFVNSNWPLGAVVVPSGTEINLDKSEHERSIWEDVVARHFGSARTTMPLWGTTALDVEAYYSLVETYPVDWERHCEIAPQVLDIVRVPVEGNREERRKQHEWMEIERLLKGTGEFLKHIAEKYPTKQEKADETQSTQ